MINKKIKKVLIPVVAVITAFLCFFLMVSAAEVNPKDQAIADDKNVSEVTSTITVPKEKHVITSAVVTTYTPVTTTTPQTTTVTTTTTEVETTVAETTEPAIEVTEPPVQEIPAPVQEEVIVTLAPASGTAEEDMIGIDGDVQIGDYTFAFNYSKELYSLCEQYGISPQTMFAIMRAESTVNQENNLCGITNIAITSFERNSGYSYSVDGDRSAYYSNPVYNMHVSAWCLSGSLSFFGGSVYDGLAGYNRGCYGHSAGSYCAYAEKVMNWSYNVA